MKDYNIDEAREILKSHNPNEIRIIPHLQERWLERDFEINYIINCLIKEIPLSISKTYMNRFKLIYHHETKTSMDLYVIIEINDFGIVNVITAYPKNKRSRERER